MRRRGLAIGIAFSGVGVGSIILLPWLQRLIASAGWRAACWALGLLVLRRCWLPLNLLLRRRPGGLGPRARRRPRRADAPAGGRAVERRRPGLGRGRLDARPGRAHRALLVDRARLLLRGLFAWYAVQVHQTKYLVEIGFSPTLAAWALGLVSLAGIPGQIALGHLSDRIGREWVWTVGALGFAICYAALLLLRHSRPPRCSTLMVVAQGLLGYGLTSVFGAIPAEIFQGRHYGAIFGTLMLSSIGGGARRPLGRRRAARPTGSYAAAFWIAMAASAISAVAIWLAAPRHVRAVAGRIPL